MLLKKPSHYYQFYYKSITAGTNTKLQVSDGYLLFLSFCTKRISSIFFLCIKGLFAFFKDPNTFAEIMKMSDILTVEIIKHDSRCIPYLGVITICSESKDVQ